MFSYKVYALSIVALIVLVLWTPAYAQSTFYTASGDTYTNPEDPDDNFSSASFLSASQWGNDIFLAFTGLDLTNMQSAHLLVQPLSSGGTFTVYGTSSFDETLVTKNNHPALGAAIATSGTLQQNVVIEVDITSYVTTSDVYLALTTTGDISLVSTDNFDPDKPRIRIDQVPLATATPTQTAILTQTVTPQPTLTPTATSVVTTTATPVYLMTPIPTPETEEYVTLEHNEALQTEYARRTYLLSLFGVLLVPGLLVLSLVRMRSRA